MLKEPLPKSARSFGEAELRQGEKNPQTNQPTNQPSKQNP